MRTSMEPNHIFWALSSNVLSLVARLLKHTSRVAPPNITNRVATVQKIEKRANVRNQSFELLCDTLPFPQVLQGFCKETKGGKPFWWPIESSFTRMLLYSNDEFFMRFSNVFEKWFEEFFCSSGTLSMLKICRHENFPKLSVVQRSNKQYYTWLETVI